MARPVENSGPRGPSCFVFLQAGSKNRWHRQVFPRSQSWLKADKAHYIIHHTAF